MIGDREKRPLNHDGTVTLSSSRVGDFCILALFQFLLAVKAICYEGVLPFSLKRRKLRASVPFVGSPFRDC